MARSRQATRPTADGTHGRHGKRKLVMAALASMLLSLVALPFSTASAQASATCKPIGGVNGGQATHVWVGGLDNNGVIASTSPGGTIHVPFGHGVYLTGVVLNGTNIVFHVTVQGANGQLDLGTANANSNCVVNQENFGPLPLVFEPEVESWSATYTDWQSGRQVTTFLGTIDVS